MTDAALRHVPVDLQEARVFLAVARGFLADANAQGLRATGRQLLLFQACLAACDAGLIAVGYKVEGSDGGHVLRFDATVEHLGLDAELLDELHNAREVRTGSAYRAGLAFDEQADATAETAKRLLAAVAALVESREADEDE
jgi:hypothetical protein